MWKVYFFDPIIRNEGPERCIVKGKIERGHWNYWQVALKIVSEEMK